MATVDLLLTGGTGRLGRELQTLLPEALAPTRAELDVTDPATVRAALERWRPAVVVHAAAYTDVAGAERDREACWRVNVLGTRHVADGCAAVGAGGWRRGEACAACAASGPGATGGRRREATRGAPVGPAACRGALPVDRFGRRVG